MSRGQSPTIPVPAETRGVDAVLGHINDVTRIDAVIPTGGLTMIAPPKAEPADATPVPVLNMGVMPDVPELSHGRLPMTRHAHAQIASAAKIPWAYYQRMYVESPGLLARNVNHWWEAQSKNRLVRVIMNGEGPKVRAWLSPSYKMLDHKDLLASVLEEAAKLTTVKIRDASVDDERLYVRLTTPIEGEIGVGDTVRLGLTLRNSEVGDGSVQVAPWIERLACLNGMVVSVKLRQVHLGSKLDLGIVSGETIQKNAEAVWSGVRDWVRFVLNEDRLEEVLAYFRLSKAVPVTPEPRIAVGNVVKNFGMSPVQANRILESYLRGNEDTQFGLVNAVTESAHHENIGGLRKQHAVEESGGELLTTSGEDFTRMIGRSLSTKQLSKLFTE